MDSHTKFVEDRLLEQLQTTREELERWKNDLYLMDSYTVSRFWTYIENAPAVIIIGDYDCDGICASYILYKAIKAKFPGKRTAVRIPKRQSEGYGINSVIVDEIKSKMPPESLIVTVDNGIAAAQILESLCDSGFKVIVTDHHELGKNRIPKVDMILDPAVDGLCSAFDGRYWCGAGVAYKLSEQVIPEDLAKDLSCFAGLATVADCMVLREGNWGLVKRAISLFRDKEAPKTLTELLVAMRQQPDYANADSFSFYLGPCFNAPGRLSDDGPRLVLDYLLTPTETKRDQIITYNETRKEIRDAEYELVKKQIEDTGRQNDCPIWVSVPGLHEGIVGILAGKVTEEYHTPAIVVTESKEDAMTLKGSARSVPGIDIFAFLNRHSDLFSKFGGHEGAAGLSMPKENFEKALQAQMPNNIKSIIESNEEAQKAFRISLDEIPNFLPVIERISPFGEGNPAPKFITNVDLNADNAEFFGQEKKHLKVERAADGYRVIHFFHEPNELHDKQNFDLVGTISRDGFRGFTYASFNAEEAVDVQQEKDDRELTDDE